MTIGEDRRVALVTPAVQMMADDAVTVPIAPYATGVAGAAGCVGPAVCRGELTPLVTGEPVV